jgi:hypothetical protein
MEGNIGDSFRIYGNVDMVDCGGGDMLESRELNISLVEVLSVCVCV